MSFRKFFFSAAAMGVLLLPGITVSASAYSLSDYYPAHKDSVVPKCSDTEGTTSPTPPPISSEDENQDTSRSEQSC